MRPISQADAARARTTRGPGLGAGRCVLFAALGWTAACNEPLTGVPDSADLAAPIAAGAAGDTAEPSAGPEGDAANAIAAIAPVAPLPSLPPALVGDDAVECVPTVCADTGGRCGAVDDGCGGTIECGCREGTTCGGGGVPGRCGCVPLTCEEAGANCGRLPDGCGGVVDCGACETGSTCGAAGVNVCGVGECTPTDPCAHAGVECGIGSDGCGNLVECGDCGLGEQCAPIGGSRRKCLGSGIQCTVEGFAAQCPQRPCQVATGCRDGSCTYGPAPCSTGSCTTPDPDCSASGVACDWRRCGAADSCPAIYCNPAPYDLYDGVLGYANLCVELTGASCGRDRSGDWACVGSACRRVASGREPRVVNGAFRSTEAESRSGVRLQNAGFVGGSSGSLPACQRIGGTMACVVGGFTGLGGP